MRGRVRGAFLERTMKSGVLGSRQSERRPMTDNDWVRIGEYSNLESAEVVAGRLSAEGVPNRVVSTDPGGPLFGALGEYSVLVPPDAAEAATRILSDSSITDADLTTLALEDPPPDDFDSSATQREDEDPRPGR